MFNLEYPKELCELHNDYSLAPDKIEIKREMLSNYQIKIADFYNIPIGNVKKLVPITEKCRGSAHRDCSINVKLNHKIPVIFRNLKNYDSHFIMQEQGKFNLKINI